MTNNDEIRQIKIGCLGASIVGDISLVYNRFDHLL
jgi:hypothetical protein